MQERDEQVHDLTNKLKWNRVFYNSDKTFLILFSLKHQKSGQALLVPSYLCPLFRPVLHLVLRSTQKPKEQLPTLIVKKMSGYLVVKFLTFPK